MSSLTAWTLTSRKVWQKSWTEHHRRSLRNWRIFALAMPSKPSTFTSQRCTNLNPLLAQIYGHAWVCYIVDIISWKHTTRCHMLVCPTYSHSPIFKNICIQKCINILSKWLCSLYCCHPHTYGVNEFCQYLVLLKLPKPHAPGDH